MRIQALIRAIGLAAVLCAIFERAAAQNLTLVINPRTGQSTIRNGGSSSVSMDGYLIASPDKVLNLPGWTSLQDSGAAGWREANPTSGHVSETSLLSSMSVSAGGSVNLGAAYTAFAPTAIGQVEPPVDFDFHVAGGASFAGDVLFAPANNVVLLVNPTTGAASIQNQANFNVSIDGYMISSPAGVLAPTAWTSFIDSGVAGWREGNPGASHLSEVNLTNSRSLTANGSPIPIGAPINAAMLSDQSDLAFDYHIAGGATVRGYVAFELPTVGSLSGDFDNNGRVDGRDFLVWQRGGSPGGLTTANLAMWRNNFGASGASAEAGAVQSVPEPSSAGLAVLAGLGGAMIRRRD